MQPTFLTYAPGASLPYTGWTDDLTAVAFYRPEQIVDELVALPRWEFVAATSLVAQSRLNRTRFPVLDRDARPLWETCRIEVRFGPRGNGHTVSARYLGTAEYTITRIRTDQPCPKTGHDARAGTICLPASCDHDLTGSTFVRDGIHADAILLDQKVGDHDLGFDRHYVRLLDDPRDVCIRMKRSRRAKGCR